MKRKINYVVFSDLVVIDGETNNIYYGGTPTLLGAKRLAMKNRYFDESWGGYNTPRIFLAKDCEYKDNKYFLKPDSKPYAIYNDVEWLI